MIRVGALSLFLYLCYVYSRDKYLEKSFLYLRSSFFKTINTYMKKTLTTICASLLLVICCLMTAYSQNIKNIQGFGDLNIGMTISEMIQVVDTTLLVEDRESVLAAGRLRGRLIVFELEKHKMGHDHYLEDINLQFLDDQLYAITIQKYNYKTEFYLTQKYGKPLLEVEEKDDEKKYRETFKAWQADHREFDNLCTATLYQNKELENTSYFLSLFNAPLQMKVLYIAVGEQE